MGVYRIKQSQLLVGIVAVVVIAWLFTRNIWDYGSVSLSEISYDNLSLLVAILIGSLYVFTMKVKITDDTFIFSSLFGRRRIPLSSVEKWELSSASPSVRKDMIIENFTIRYKKGNYLKRFTLYYANYSYENFQGMLEELERFSGKKVKKIKK